MKVLFFSLVFLSFAFSQDNEYCLECHSDKELTKTVNDSIEVSLYVSESMFENSVHEGFDCVSCHQISIDDHPGEGSVGEMLCADCHEDVQEEYIGSIHGTSHLAGIKLAATCSDCHGTHQISDHPMILNQKPIMQTLLKLVEIAIPNRK